MAERPAFGISIQAHHNAMLSINVHNMLNKWQQVAKELRLFNHNKPTGLVISVIQHGKELRRRDSGNHLFVVVDNHGFG
jgi:hypothetical protein